MNLAALLPLPISTRLAERRLMNGNASGAIDLATAVAHRDARNVDLYGFLFEIMKVGEAASHDIEREMRRGLDLNPESTEIAELLVMVLAEQQRYDAAKEIVAHFDGAESHLTISLAIMRANRALIDDDLETALRELERGLGLVDQYSDPDVVYRLAVCLISGRIEEGDEGQSLSWKAWDQGIKLLRRLVDERTSDPMVYVTLALELEEGDPEEAKSILNVARKRFKMPSEFDVYVNELRERHK